MLRPLLAYTARAEGFRDIQYQYMQWSSCTMEQGETIYDM